MDYDNGEKKARKEGLRESALLCIPVNAVKDIAQSEE